MIADLFVYRHNVRQTKIVKKEKRKKKELHTDKFTENDKKNNN